MIDLNEQNRQFTAAQVCTKCGLAPYILRYWEIHFPELRGPDGKQKAFYTTNDLSLVWRIKKLLYVERLSIEQAKKKLHDEKLFPLSEPGFAPVVRSSVPQPKAPEEVKAAVEPAPSVPVPKPVSETPTEAVPSAAAQEKFQPSAEQILDEQARAEQIRAEQARAEQIRAEQARAEQIRAEQVRAEQIRAEQARRYQEALERAQIERRKVLRRRQVEAALTELRELRAKLG
ncbi:MAG: MerR family transcriptional regulator [Duodenibacillus sp.]|nr:MerR family transcriptional regulator [Duodenibacillus sp.]